MGLTELGYKRKTYEEILKGKVALARQFFGDDIDVSDITPLGKILRINAYDQAEAEESIELLYYAISPHTATGISLDRVCKLVGISRNAATAAQYGVTITGKAGYTVPLGFLVGTTTELNYYNMAETIIGEDGTCQVVVECEQKGSIGNCNPAELSVIIKNDNNITSARATTLLVTGTEAENDYELRKRFDMAVHGAGSGNEDAIKAALIKVPSVLYSTIIVNLEDVPDSAGRPPHSFECFVYGGEGHDMEIAQTIYEKQPLGIKSVGNIKVVVQDKGGYDHDIYFTRMEEVGIHVRYGIETSAVFETDGLVQIERKIRDHIDDLGVNNPVIFSTLYSPIYSVPGVTKVSNLEISTDGVSYHTADVPINSWQVAKCLVVHGEVTP